MVIDKSFDISKHSGVPVSDEILGMAVEFPDENKGHDKEALYPFDEFVSPM